MSQQTFAANQEFINKFSEFAQGPSPESIARSTYLNLVSALNQGIEKINSEIRDKESEKRELEETRLSTYFNNGAKITSSEQEAYLSKIVKFKNQIRKIESEIKSFNLTITDYKEALIALEKYKIVEEPADK